MSSDQIISKINTSGADFLVVSLGAKKGQGWISRNQERLSVPVISHLGAVVGFVAETAKRAPPWAQRSGLEWLWRIKEEPALWIRYFGDGLVLLRLLITRVIPYAWLMRRQKPTLQELSSVVLEIEDRDNEVVIRLGGAWVRDNLTPLREYFSNAVSAGKEVRLEMGAVTYVDSAFVGLVMLLHDYHKQHGTQLRMILVQEPVRRIFKYCCADYLLMNACQPWESGVNIGAPGATASSGTTIQEASKDDLA